MTDTKPKDGGPAFPVSTYDKGGMYVATTPGMTLRDWFAGQVLSGLCSYYGWSSPRDSMVENAYVIADAMLEARYKGT